jgi:hypothetical protein
MKTRGFMIESVLVLALHIDFITHGEQMCLMMV